MSLGGALETLAEDDGDFTLRASACRGAVDVIRVVVADDEALVREGLVAIVVEPTRGSRSSAPPPTARGGGRRRRCTDPTWC